MQLFKTFFFFLDESEILSIKRNTVQNPESNDSIQSSVSSTQNAEQMNQNKTSKISQTLANTASNYKIWQDKPAHTAANRLIF